MTKPTQPTVPDVPSRTDPTTFADRADTFVAFFPTFATYMDNIADYTNEQADSALAAALLQDLPPIAGEGGNYLRLNTGETALEFRTASENRTDLGLGTIATQDADSVNIDGGAIDGVTIGGNSAGVGTFAAINVESATFATFDLQDTGGTSTHQTVRIQNGDGSFSIQTRDSSGTLVSSDYDMTLGASGATDHSLRIEGIEKLKITATNFTADEVYNQTSASAANVFVASGGQLLRSTSSGEFKAERRPVTEATGNKTLGEIIDGLNPVSFLSTHDGDNGARFTGFIAEEVADAFPEASVDSGQNYDPRALLALLWAEVQDLRSRVAVLEGN